MPDISIRDALPPTIFSLCYREIVRAAKTWGPLAALRPRWITWDGPPSDGEQADTDPMVGLDVRPVIKLTPGAGQSGWATVGQHRTPFTVRLEITVGGTRVDDLMAVWCQVAGGAVDPASVGGTGKVVQLKSALYPDDRVLLTKLENLGAVSAPVVTRPAITLDQEPGNAVSITAAGDIQVELYADTNP